MFAQFGLTVTTAALLAGLIAGSPVSSMTAPALDTAKQASAINMADVQLSAMSHIAQLPAHNASVLLVDGTNLKIFRPSPVGISFNCLFCAYEHIEEILYPRKLDSRSPQIGTENLLVALDRTTGKVLVAGFSQGAGVNKGAREKMVKDGNLSRVNELTFFDYGVPGFTSGPDSPFTTIKVAYEYDGIAVWPANPFNLLAYANAMQGALKVHPQMYENADINELAKWVKYEGNTTYIVLRNDDLPVISKFAYAIGLGEMIEKIIRPGIDRAYRWEKLGFVKVTGPVIDVTAPVGEARFVQESAPSLMMGVNQDSRESDEPMQGKVDDVDQQPEAEVSPSVTEQQEVVQLVSEPEVVEQTPAGLLDVVPEQESTPEPESVDLSEDDQELVPSKDTAEEESSKDSAQTAKAAKAEARKERRTEKRENASASRSSGSTGSDD